MPTDSKACTKCGTVKAVGEFFRNSRATDGRQSRCKVCHVQATLASRTKNPEAARAANRKWRAAHPGAQAAYSLSWRQRYPDRQKESERKWRANNPDKVRSKSAARRARQRNAPRLTVFRVTDIFARDKWVCGLCDSPIDPTEKWPSPLSVSLDHILPLSRGGAHTPDNCQTAHLGCNSRKGARV